VRRKSPVKVRTESSDKARRKHSESITTVKSPEKKIETSMKGEVVKTMNDYIYLEREVEKLKLELARRVDYTAQAAFMAFNPKELQHMDQQEFTETILKFIGIQGFKSDHARLMFHRFATPRLGY
jgi:hypothetical protein